MKLTVVLLIATFSASAQVVYVPTTGVSSTSTNNYVGLGAGNSSPAAQLHINSSVERQSFRLYKAGITNQYLSIFQGTAAAAVDPIGTGLLYLGYDQVTDVLMNGRLGIGTQSPINQLHVASGGDTYIRVEKAATTNEGGIFFARGTYGLFYIFSDGDGDDALKIRASNLSGEDDSSPRMQFPHGNRNIYMAQSGGNVGIGTSSPDAKLSVNGQVHATEVKVTATVPGPDYVFEKDYSLPTLEQINSYITQNKHLPDVPSAKDMEEKGINLGEMNMQLLRKVEELTLYAIEQSKRLDDQQKKIEKLESQIGNNK